MHRQAVIAAISDGIARLGQSLPAGAPDKLATLLIELERWNGRINLTAIRDLESMIPAHVLDSLAVRPFIVPPRVADIGTGAGFPGLPLAIADPELEIELLDSSGKKIAFLRHIINELGVTNVRAVQARVESYAPPTRFDTVVARALAGLSQLLEMAGHLVADRGVLLALKGQYPHDEIEQLARMISLTSRWEHRVTQLTVAGLEEHARHLVELRRRAANPA